MSLHHMLRAALQSNNQSFSTFAKTYDTASAAVNFRGAKKLSTGEFVVAFTTASGAGFQLLNANGTTNGQSYFISGISNCNLDIDLSDNIYLVHSTGVIKCDTSGTIAWQKTGFTSINSLLLLDGVAYSAENNSIAVNGFPSNAANSGVSSISVLDLSGNHVWSRTLTLANARTEMHHTLASGSDYFVAGLFGNYAAGIVKFNSSGSTVFQNSWGFDCTSGSVNTVTGQSAICSYNQPPAPGVRVFNSVGTCISGVNYGTRGSFTAPIVMLNDDGTYVTAMRDWADTTYNSMAVFKHNSAGGVIWSYGYRWSNNAIITPSFITLDQNGNYVITGATNTTSNDGFICNLNSSNGDATTSATWIRKTVSMGSTPSTTLNSRPNRTIASVTPTLTNSSLSFTRLTLSQILSN